MLAVFFRTEEAPAPRMARKNRSSKGRFPLLRASELKERSLEIIAFSGNPDHFSGFSLIKFSGKSLDRRFDA
jgi:hypothetical protein